MSEYNWCHGSKCHEHKTTDRIRGVKGSKVLRTRKIAQNNWNKNTVWSSFCSQGCWNDFMHEHWEEFMALYPRTECLETPIDVQVENRDTYRYKYNGGEYERVPHVEKTKTIIPINNN